MPFALVFIGLVMIVAGARDTYADLGKELIADFTGPGNFLYWFAVIAALGALGSIPQFRSFSRWFMALVIIAMVIRNGGFFDKLMQAIGTPVVNPEKGSSQQTGQADQPGVSYVDIPKPNTSTAAQNASTVFDFAKLFF